MKKTALTASAITLLASGVGLGNEGSATASGSVSATATASASAWGDCRDQQGNLMGMTCYPDTSRSFTQVDVYDPGLDLYTYWHPCVVTDCKVKLAYDSEWK
jgi:hypothetical protein